MPIQKNSGHAPVASTEPTHGGTTKHRIEICAWVKRMTWVMQTGLPHHPYEDTPMVNISCSCGDLDVDAVAFTFIEIAKIHLAHTGEFL
jgi:hypothetical protein